MAFKMRSGHNPAFKNIGSSPSIGINSPFKMNSPYNKVPPSGYDKHRAIYKPPREGRGKVVIDSEFRKQIESMLRQGLFEPEHAAYYKKLLSGQKSKGQTVIGYDLDIPQNSGYAYYTGRGDQSSIPSGDTSSPKGAIEKLIQLQNKREERKVEEKTDLPIEKTKTTIPETTPEKKGTVEVGEITGGEVLDEFGKKIPISNRIPIQRAKVTTEPGGGTTVTDLDTGEVVQKDYLPSEKKKVVKKPIIEKKSHWTSDVNNLVKERSKTTKGSNEYNIIQNKINLALGSKKVHDIV